MALPINQTVPACPANITTWTDPTLVENIQQVRKTHVDELREAVNRERERRVMSETSFVEDPTITASVTEIRKPHIDELRSSIEQAANTDNCVTDSVPSPSWTDPTIQSDITKVRRIHMIEMRQVINAMETVCVCDCNYCSCNCNCTCHCCTCECNHSHRW